MSKFILALTTVPSEEEGQKIARELVENRLAACVTVSGASQSFYWWDKKISQDKEHVLLIKTREDLYSSLEKKICEIHPYEVPEIIAFPLIKGYSKYLNWLASETADSK